MKKIHALAALSLLALLAGCGSSDSGSASTSTTTASVSGYVADGYLSNATIFLDMNNNLQLDEGEPRTTSGPGGYYALTGLDPALMQYPVVVLAQSGVTYDSDAPNQPIAHSYLLCAPAGATDFVSPLSTLVQERMQADPTRTLAQAVEQTRQELGLPAGSNLLGDYIAGNNTSLHTMAQNMVALMMEQRAQVMNSDGTDVNADRYHAMLRTMNTYAAEMYRNVSASTEQQATFRDTMRNRMQTSLAGQL
jgi:hypothetical protein